VSTRPEIARLARQATRRTPAPIPDTHRRHPAGLPRRSSPPPAVRTPTRVATTTTYSPSRPCGAPIHALSVAASGSPSESAPPTAKRASSAPPSPTTSANPTVLAGRWPETPATTRTHSAQGISDAFRDAELCATALDQALSGARSYGEAMSRQAARDEHVLPMHEFTTQLATSPHRRNSATSSPPSAATRKPWTASHGSTRG
jgi:hypothetical protein